MVITIRSILENFLQVCIHKIETVLDSVKLDDRGLTVAIAQNVDTGAILMQGFFEQGSSGYSSFLTESNILQRGTFNVVDEGGETSNNFINVHDIFLDCARDSACCLLV
ncbi:unnamed protein product [Prunus brigantina]